MKAGLLATIRWAEGFNSSSVEDYEGDALGPGSKNLLIDGEGKLKAFKGLTALSGNGSRVMFPFGASWAGLGDSGGDEARGSIFAGPGLSLIYIGLGDLILSGTSLATAASTVLAIRLLRSGSYTSGGALNGPFTAGLPAPLAGVLSAKPATVGTLTGAVSIKHTWVRNSTGAEGNASDASNVVTFATQVAQYVISETPPNGADRVRIYASPRGFGGTGPQYFYIEKAASEFTGGTPVDLDFSDADLQARLAPIDHNVPPEGVWAFQLESAWAVVGCYGDTVDGVTVDTPGNSISVSKVNRYEAFPADFLLGLPSAPTGIAQRASDAFIYIWGKSWLGACSFTGSTPPMSFQVLWASTGFANQHSACVAAGGQLYGFSSKRGPIRIQSDGEPDTKFADKIQKTVETWNPDNVVVGNDPDHTQVIYMHGSEMLCFNTTIEKWSSPIDISATPVSVAGSIVSCATNGSSLAFSVNNAGTFTPYPFNTGTSGSVWEAYSTWRTGGGPGLLKTIGPVRSRFKHDDLARVITTKIFKQNSNGVYSTASASKTITRTITETGDQELPIIKSNVRNAKAFCLYQTGRSGSSGESAPISFEVMGTINFVRK